MANLVDQFEIDKGTDVVTKPASQIQPTEFQLLNNYPNPLTQETIINVELSDEFKKLSGYTLPTIEIYNSLGERIRVLNNGVLTGSNVQYHWDCTDMNRVPVSTGTYLYRIQGEKSFKIKRMTIIK